MTKTADGVELRKGMTIFLLDSCHRQWKKNRVDHWEGKKLWYLDPDPEGHTGARIASCYAEIPQKGQGDEPHE